MIRKRVEQAVKKGARTALFVIPAKAGIQVFEAFWTPESARMPPKARKPLTETIFFVNYKHLSENRGCFAGFPCPFFSLTNGSPSI